MADRDMLRQVVVNLLDNAVKYGPAGQTVTVEVLTRPRAALIAVTDQGPGVPPAERALVFQRFWRGPRVNGITGTGIGLALVQELVALHGGSVVVAAGPDGGARFEVCLPREAA
jgi:signal transduction histidine kinase